VKFTDTHEWVDVNGDIATIGISDHAQKELGEIVYVELPQLKKQIAAGQESAVLESTKSAADVYAPLSGEIIAVNEALKSAPELINKDAEKDGWIYKIQLSNSAELDKLVDRESYYRQFQ
jgi:glycine cleavage system H protein